MSVYFIAEVEVTDDGWVPDYAAQVHKIVERHGGRYLSRSGAIELLEGDRDPGTLVAIIEFPDRAAVAGFLDDPDYAPFGQARRAGSRSRILTIDDSDLAGAIPYLKAG